MPNPTVTRRAFLKGSGALIVTFAASGVAGMVSSTVTLFVLSYVMPLLPAKLLSIAVSFAVNFSLSHFVVFRARQPGEDAR